MRLALAGLLASYIFSPVAWALDVSVSGSATVSDFNCPSWGQPHRPATQIPNTPPADPVRRSSVAHILDAPSSAAAHLPLMHAKQPINSIGFWGDSHLAAAFFSEEMSRAMGWIGQVRTSYLPPTMGRGGVRLPLRKHCKSPTGWRFVSAIAEQSAGLATAPGLVGLESIQDGAELWLDFRQDGNGPALTALRMDFAPVSAAGLRLQVQIDQESAQILDLPAGSREVKFIGRTAFSQLRLQVISGSVHLQGFAPEYARPGSKVLDIFGIPGAVARGWNGVQSEDMRSRLGFRPYDLVILEYGTNEGNDSSFNASRYRASLDSSITAMKHSFPTAQCLLIGPTDRGNTPQRGQSSTDWLKYSRIHAKISGIQRDLALQHQCGYWDWQGAMGGPGAAFRWYFNSPQWMARDFIHLSVSGYKESARRMVRDMGL